MTARVLNQWKQQPIDGRIARFHQTSLDTDDKTQELPHAGQLRQELGKMLLADSQEA